MSMTCATDSIRSGGQHDARPLRLGRAAACLESPATRYRIYAWVALAFYLLAWLAQTGKSLQNREAIDFVAGDVEGYYVYLPAVLLHGNMDFGPRLIEHKAAHKVDLSHFPPGKWGLKNRWPIGVALTLAPAFLLAHAMSEGLFYLTGQHFFEPNGYSILYQFFCVTFALTAALGSLMLADRLLVTRFRSSGAVATAAILSYWVGTNYAYYFFREPLMAHLLSGSWVIASVYCADQILAALREDRVVWWHWPMLSLAISMAGVCRVTNVCIFPLAAYVVYATVRAGAASRVARLLPLIALGALPLGAQWLAWHLTVGPSAETPAQLGYGGMERFFWGSPALLEILFSSNHGLFFWSPLLLLGVWGLAWDLRRRRDPIVVCLVLSGLLLWYVNSAWWAWSFGKSFGARAFTDLAIVFIIGLAMGFESLADAARPWRNAILAAVGACILFNWVLMALFIGQKIPRDMPLWGTNVPTRRL